MADIFIYDGHISSSHGFDIQVSESTTIHVSHSEGQGFEGSQYGARVGIGMVSASAPLHVEGGYSGQDIAIFQRTEGLGGETGAIAASVNSGDPQIHFTRDTGDYAIGLNDGDNSFQIVDGSSIDNGTVRFTIDSGGRVLIGTATSLHSSADLQIVGASGNYARIMMKDSDGTNQVGFIDKTGAGLNFVSQNDTDHGNIKFNTYNGTDTETRLYIKEDGTVGIGTTSPAAKLEVIGNISGSGGFTGSFAAGHFANKVAINVPNEAGAGLASSADLIIGSGIADVNVTLFGDEDSTTQASLWFADNTSGATPHYGGVGLVYDGDANHLTIRKGGSANNLFAIDGDNGNTSIGLTSGDSAGKLQVYGDIIVGDGEENIISSPTYFSGFAGSGFRIGSGSSGVKLEIDNLSVRNQFNVYELVANQVRATNGSLWISNAGKIISSSQLDGFSPATWPVSFSMFFETGSDALDHGFVRGDLIRAQKFDGANVYQSNMTVVSRSDSGSIIAALEDQSKPPSASFDYVRIGHTFDTDRDAAIYLTAQDTNSPYIDVIDEVDSHAAFNQSGKIKARLGNLTGITDPTAGALSGYGLYSENVYLTGKVSATSGDIGGFSIDATTISSSNDNLILRSTGQITASDFLFQGSGVITGSVSIGSSVTVGGQLSVGSNPKLPSDQHLVAYWNFDQGTGSLIREQVGLTDDDGNRFDVDLHNDPALDNLKIIYASESYAISGKSLKNPGSSNQPIFNVTSSISSSAYPGPSGSISFWFNTNYDTGSGDSSWQLWNGGMENAASIPEAGEYYRAVFGGSPSSFYVEAVHNNVRNFIFDDNSGGIHSGNVISKSLAAANSGSTGWIHWAFTWGSGSAGGPDSKFRIYINGELTKFVSLSGSCIDFVPSSSGVRIGNALNTDAYLDEVRVYNTCISDQEVRGLYLSPGGVNTGTTVTGDQIQTGQMRSNNWNNNDAGSMIDLTNGKIHMGGLESNARLYFDGTNLTVSGSVSASEGNIGGWKIEQDKFVDGADTIRLQPNGTYVISSSNFQVDDSGAITASAGLLSGSVTASQANIGGWTINHSAITSDNDHVKLNSSAKRFTINSQTFSEKGIQLEYNSGEPRAYIGDGSKTGSWIQYDETNGVRLGPDVTLAFGSTMLPGDNLLNDFSNLSITDPWVQSATPNYYLHDSAADNEISMSVGPHGINEKVWVASPDSDGKGGGWKSDWFPIDSGSTYQFSTYVKFLSHATGSNYFGMFAAGGPDEIANWVAESDWPRHSAYTGSIYYGAQNSGSVEHYASTNTHNRNPYFVADLSHATVTGSGDVGGLGGELDRWYLYVAYVHATGSHYTEDKGGMYDTVTGRKLMSLYDQQWTDKSVIAMARAFNHDGFEEFADDDTPSMIWAKPAVRKVTQATTDISSFIDIGSAIATGQYSGSSTFITSTSIFSPNIAGQDGYISNKFTVGTANDGVTLDGTNKKIYIGAGNYKNDDTAFYVASASNGEYFSLADKLSWDGQQLQITGALSLTAGDASASIAQLEIDSGSFASTITSNSQSLASSIAQNIDSIELLVTSASNNSSSVSQLNIETGSINASVSALNETSGTLEGSVAALEIATGSINLSVQNITGVVTGSQFNNLDWSQGYTGWNWSGHTSNWAGLNSIATAGQDLDSWVTGSMPHLAEIAYTSGSLGLSMISSLQSSNINGGGVAVNSTTKATFTADPNTDYVDDIAPIVSGRTYTLMADASGFTDSSCGFGEPFSNHLGAGNTVGEAKLSAGNGTEQSIKHTFTATGTGQMKIYAANNTAVVLDNVKVLEHTDNGKMFEIVSGSNISGSRFGRALEVRSSEDGNQIWIYSNEAVPVDTDRVYQGVVRARLSHVGDNSETVSYLYAGFACLDAQGNDISESPGTHRYFVASSRDLLDADPYTWKSYSGSITSFTTAPNVTTGSGTNAEDHAAIANLVGNNLYNNQSTGYAKHNVFKTGTKYVRPVLIFNYAFKDTAMQIDGFTIQDVTKTVESSASLSVTATSITSTVSSNTGAISTLDQGSASFALTVATASNITALAINPQGVQISGSALEFSGSSFFFGIGTPADAVTQEGAFISGSGGNIEISSSNFHLMASGSAIFSGSISASQGDIGGWSIQEGKLSSNNITLSSSNEEIVVGPNKEIILSGSGAGQLAGGGITFDKFGNLRINNAELVVSGGSGLQPDIYDSANSKWVVMDDMINNNKIFYATYEPDTQITIMSGSVILSSSIQPEQYFVGEWGHADIQAGYIIDADKPIQIVTDDSGMAIVPYTMLSKEFFIKGWRDASASDSKLTVFSPYGSASVTMSHSDGNDGTFTDDFNYFSCPPVSMSTFGELKDYGQYIHVQSDQPILAYHKYSATTDLIGVLPPSKQLISGRTETIILPYADFSLGEEYEKYEPTAVSGVATGGSYGQYTIANSPFQIYEDGDGDGNAGRYAIPVEALGDRYILPHEINGYQIIAIEPTTIKTYKLQGNGDTELYGVYDLTAASKTNPLSVNEGSSTHGGSGIHADGMLFEGTAPFALMASTEDGDEFMALGYRAAQQSTYRGSTTISGDKIRTGKIQSNNWNNNDAGSLIDLTDGTAHLGGSGSNARFYFNSEGNLRITGSISAQDGNFTGVLSSSEGNIGGWEIESSSINAGNASQDRLVISRDGYASISNTSHAQSKPVISMYNTSNKFMVNVGNIYKTPDNQGMAVFSDYSGTYGTKIFEASKNLITNALTASIAGFNFDGGSLKIQTTDGTVTETILELNSTTTPGDYIISASQFQVNTVGALTASAATIEGNITVTNPDAFYQPSRLKSDYRIALYGTGSFRAWKGDAGSIGLAMSRSMGYTGGYKTGLSSSFRYDSGSDETNLWSMPQPQSGSYKTDYSSIYTMIQEHNSGVTLNLPPNLLPNGNPSTDTSGWSAEGSALITRNTGGSSTDWPHGARIQVIGDTGNTSWVAAVSTATVEVGKKYHVRAMVRNSSTSTQAIYFRTSFGSVNIHNTSDINVNVAVGQTKIVRETIIATNTALNVHLMVDDDDDKGYIGEVFVEEDSASDTWFNIITGSANIGDFRGISGSGYDLFVFSGRGYGIDNNYEAKQTLDLFDEGYSVLSMGNNTTETGLNLLDDLTIGAGNCNETGSGGTEWPIKTNQDMVYGSDWTNASNAPNIGLQSNGPGSSTGSIATSSGDWHTGLTITDPMLHGWGNADYTTYDGQTTIPAGTWVDGEDSSGERSNPFYTVYTDGGGTKIIPIAMRDADGTVMLTPSGSLRSNTTAQILAFYATNPRGGRWVHMNAPYDFAHLRRRNPKACERIMDFLLRRDLDQETYQAGITKIDGGMITAGQITSNNWGGPIGTEGTLFDLNNGKLQMRSASADVFSFDATEATASIAGWTFTNEKFYSNKTQPVRGINMNKDRGIRGRNTGYQWSFSGSVGGPFDFSPPANPTPPTLPATQAYQSQYTGN